MKNFKDDLLPEIEYVFHNIRMELVGVTRHILTIQMSYTSKHKVNQVQTGITQGW